MTMDNEQRKEPRVDREETVYVEILSTSVNDDGGLVVKCLTKDISNQGLKVISNYPITVGAILELLVDFDKDAMKYLLTGEVKWCYQTSTDPEYQCGFELIEAEHSDVSIWRELFDDFDTPESDTTNSI